MSDDRDSPVVLGRHALGTPLALAQRLIRTRDVRQEPGAARAVSDPPQPPRHCRERVVAGEKPWQQQDRPTVTAGRSPPAKDRADQEAGGVELPAELAEVVSPPPRLGP
jgi:hypothetical protein